MPRLGIAKRANHRELVHHAGHHRQLLTDLHARDIRRNRPPGAGNLTGRFRLEIEKVLVRRTTHQVNQDYRLGRVADSRASFQRQQLRQRQAGGPQGPDLDEITARNAVTMGL